MIKAGGIQLLKLRQKLTKINNQLIIEPYVDMKILCLTNIFRVRSALSNDQCDISAKVVLFDFESNIRKVANWLKKLNRLQQQSCHFLKDK